MAKDDDSKTAGDAGKKADKTGSGDGAGQAQPPAQANAASSAPAGAAATNADGDAIAMLKADHRKVEKLFDEFERADQGRKDQIIQEACRELIVHTLLEEQIFYPAVRQKASDEEPLDEAQVEHDGVKLLIRELMDGERDDEYRQAKFKVMAEQTRHHIKEEEKPGEGVFALAQKGGLDLKGLGERLKSKKQELMARPDRLRPSRPVAFTELGGERQSYQEASMPRDRGPDRDERGRFTSDDDDDRGGGRYASERSGGGRRDRDDDRGQGGWFGDPRGHSEASRRGWEERRSYDDGDRDYRSRGRDDDDRGRERDGGRRGGWFGDSRGHSEAARKGWDDPDHGPSGWYGDSRGHSEASRRGWDNPDHGPSGWYGDSRGHSEASRKGWENSDHGRSGWYGDPEGHSEASRRGWEERGGGSRSTRSRDDDDDDRRSRSRGRDDDDGRGWYGDSRGHSEASRRGWDNRR